MMTERKLGNLAKKMLVLLDERPAALDIFLLPHREMKALKARFFKKQTEPNVLSFPEPLHFPHPELSRGGYGAKQGVGRRNGAVRYLGEIYLNRDILAKSPGRTAPLLLHGILHLLGYDHVKNADAKKMEALEQKLLIKIL
jgi:probable rRNA maturation factor